MWDRVGSDGNLINNSEIKEMMSHEESGDDEILPSWDFLDTTLNQKLLHYTHLDPDRK